MKRFIRHFKMLSIFLVFALGTQVAFGQERTIRGSVTDASTGELLPGVSIIIEGTATGTVTDFDGNYTLKASKGQSLLFNYVGYVTQKILIEDQTTLNVLLSVDTEQLEEVVVIGYGTAKKKDLTGSVQTVSSDDFNQGAISSPQQLMNGKVAGVQITSDGGAPGAKSTIKIRGGSSLSASNDPLIIIDGVPIDNEEVAGMRNPLNVVNPNDIETFTVLKDASATAIYGSRASNGVILITTKKGSKTGLSIDYSGNVSISTPTKTVDILKAEEYRKVLTEQFPDNVNLLGEANTDWQDEIYRTAVSTDHNVAVSGTIAEEIPYRASVGYSNANGILDKSNMTRNTAALNLSPAFFENHLRVNVSAKGMYIKNNNSNTDAIGGAISIDPTQPIRAEGYDDFGGYFAWQNAVGDPNVNSPDNPRAVIDQRRDISTVSRFVGNMQLDYKFHFLPELRANLNMGIDASKGQDKGGKQTYAEAAWDKGQFDRGGGFEKYTQNKRNKLLDFYLQYNKDLPEINSRFDVMGGYSWQHFWAKRTDASWFNEPNAQGETVNKPEVLTKNENYLVSFFGRLNYVFHDKYYLTFTLRSDGSSRFSEDNRWGTFPSLALAWNIKDEPFLKDVDAISNLKLKLGYGITGQQNIGQDYGYFGTYKVGQPTAQYVYYNNNAGSYEKIPFTTIRPNGYDADLKWEETTTYNFGVDYGLFDNRIYGNLDVYLRKTNDLLNEIPIPAGANLINRLTTNVGSVENKGFEFSINALAYKDRDFTWNVGANIAYNKNEITKLTKVEDPNYLGVLHEGISGGTGNNIKIHTVGKPAGSFFVYEQIYDKNGRPIEGLYSDKNGDGIFNESDFYVAGSPAPDVMIGLNTSLTYKEWDFSMSGRANLGMDVYNNIASNTGYYDRLQVNGEYLNNINKDVFKTGFNSAQYFSDYYVQDASFFRLDNITVGYNLDTFMGRKMNMRVYSSVSNVFVITDYDGVDPEIDNGVDDNVYPRPRTFLFGVNVTF